MAERPLTDDELCQRLSASLSIDTLTSPPLYSEASEESTATSTRAADGARAPSYQASVQGGDRIVLGGPRHDSAPAQQDPEDTFFDIAPSSDATSFQVGYLGLLGFEAWIKGDVLLKLGASLHQRRSSFYKCILELRAVEVIESGPGHEEAHEAVREVELFYSSIVLWDASAATSSATPAAEVPTTMPFSFALTQDLPHCIHLPRSRLAYTLRATLHSSNPATTSSLVKVVPVHLTRYSAPGPLQNGADEDTHDNLASEASRFSLRPHTWRTTSPAEMYVELERTIFRRSEPINFRVLIPPLPDRRLMTEKSLHLRAIEADFVRIITVLQPSRSKEAQLDASAKAKDKGKFSEVEAGPSRSSWAADHDETLDDERVPSYDVSIPDEPRAPAESEAGPSTQPIPDESPGDGGSTSSRPGPDANASNRYETLLAHSGKLCRFSTHKAVNLRLTLHPPFSAPNMPHPHPDHDAFAVAARSASMYVRPSSTREGPGPDGGETSAEGSSTGGGASPAAGRSELVETAAPGSLAGGSGCESITQETLLHRVHFEVRLRVALDGGPAGRKDVRFVREVCILPGAAGEAVADQPPESQASASDQASSSVVPGSEDSADAEPQHRSADSKTGASSATGKQQADDNPFVNFNDDEEYDGYEDVMQDVDHDYVQPLPSRPDAANAGSDEPIPYLTSSSGSTLAEQHPAEDRQAVTRSAAGMEAEPPPTLQESQHHLQVQEVEIEGVGFAVPRRRLPNTNEEAPGFYETYSHPTLLAGQPTFDSVESGSLPPPLSPARAHAAEDFPPPPPSTSSDRDDVDLASRQEDGDGVSVRRTFEPPPYLANESNLDRPPSFHHAQADGNLVDLSRATIEDAPPGIDGQGAHHTHSPPPHSSSETDQDRGDARTSPPAYPQIPSMSAETSPPGASQGPPSYSLR